MTRSPFPLVTYTLHRRRDRLLKRRRQAYAAVSCDLYLLATSTAPSSLSDFRGATLYPLVRGHTTVVTAADSDPCAIRVASADLRATPLIIICRSRAAASSLAAALSAASASLSGLQTAVIARRRTDDPGLHEMLESLRAGSATTPSTHTDADRTDMTTVLSNLTVFSGAVKGTASAFMQAGEWASALADTVSTTQSAMHVFERVFGALPIAAPIIQVVGLAADVAVLAVERGERDAEMRALSSKCTAMTRDIVSGLFFSMDCRAVEDASVDNLFGVMHKVCEVAREAERYVMKGRAMQMLTVDQVSTLSAQVAEIETLVTSLRILQYVQENHARNQRVDESVKDVYRRSMLVTPSAVSSVMLFDREDTPEAKLRDKLFDEGCTSGLVGAVGMSGVGKTSILTAIANDPSIRRYFDGGIYEMELGAGCSAISVISGLAGVVERSGGVYTSDKIRGIQCLDDAILATKDWFFGHRCLFILDDGQETEESSSGFVRELRGIVDLTVGSRALFSTWSRTLAYSAANPRDIVEVEPRNMIVASQILCKHADIDISAVEELRQTNPSNKGLKAFDKLLKSCGGLPVCFAVVGKAIASMPRSNHKNGLESCRALLEGERENSRLLREALATTSLENYLGYGKSIDAMWEAFVQSELRVGRFSASELRQMNNALCVLQSGTWTPTFVLKRLWGVELHQVHSVVLAVESASALKTRRAENRMEVHIHRLMLEYCTECATKNLEMPPKAWHNQLLASYMDNSETRNRAWWTCADVWDGYMRENVVRHLLGADAYEELRALLLDFRWIQTCLDNALGNFVSALDLLENDYRAVLPHACSSHFAPVSDLHAWHELGVTLSLIADSLRLSRDSLVRRPSEVSFQTIGRLVGLKNKPDIQEFLRSVEVHAREPIVRSIRPSLTPAGGPLVQAIDVGWSIYAMAVIPKSSWVVVGGTGGAAIVDLQRGNVMQVLRESRGWGDAVVNVATTKQGTHAVCGWADGKVTVWDLSKTNSEMGSFQVGSGDTCVAVTRDGKHVVTGDEDGNVGVWDLTTGAMVREPNQLHRLQISCLALKGDEDVVASGSRDGSVCTSQIFGKKSSEIVEGMRGHVTCAAWTSCGQRIFVASEFSGASVHRCDGGEDGEELKGVGYSVVSMQVNDDDKVVVCGCMDGNVYVCDVETRQAACDPLVGHTGTVDAVAFAGDGEQIVSGSHDGSVRMWRVKATSARHAGHASSVSCLGASANGNMIASGSHDETVRVWSMESGELLVGPLQGARGRGAVATSVALSMDGSRVACGYKSGAVWVWDTQTGEAIHEGLTGHDGAVRCVAFSTDGGLLASGGKDKKVRVWDATAGHTLHELCGHSNWVASVCFDTCGGRVASGSYDKTVRLWDAHTGRSLGAGIPIGDRATTLAFTEGDSALRGWMAFSDKVETISVADGARIPADVGEARDMTVSLLKLRAERREMCNDDGVAVARLDHPVSAGPLVDERRQRVWAGLQTGTLACVELVAVDSALGSRSASS